MEDQNFTSKDLVRTRRRNARYAFAAACLPDQPGGYPSWGKFVLAGAISTLAIVYGDVALCGIIGSWFAFMSVVVSVLTLFVTLVAVFDETRPEANPRGFALLLWPGMWVNALLYSRMKMLSNPQNLTHLLHHTTHKTLLQYKDRLQALRAEVGDTKVERWVQALAARGDEITTIQRALEANPSTEEREKLLAAETISEENIQALIAQLDTWERAKIEAQNQLAITHKERLNQALREEGLAVATKIAAREDFPELLS